MPAAIFTQTVCLLCPEVPDVREIGHALGAAFAPVPPHAGDDGWAFCGEGFATTRAEQRRVVVDLVPRAWPDDMGDPKANVTVFGAWVAGTFGMYAYPGALERAIALTNQYPSPPAELLEHAAFIRIRSSYALARGDDQPVVPPDADHARDMIDVLQIAVNLLSRGQGAAWFAPGGEVIAPAGVLEQLLARHRARGTLPFEGFVNVRMYTAQDEHVVDTVGAGQFFVNDVELVTSARLPDANAAFAYALGVIDRSARGEPLPAGTTVPGPTGPFVSALEDESLGAPPRRVVRLRPAPN